VSEESVDVVRRAFIAWQAGAMGELEALLADDVVWKPTPLSGTGDQIFRGRAGVTEWVSAVLSRGGEVRNEIDELRDLGDRVLVLGSVFERVGDEVRVDAELAWLFQIRDERIVRGEGFLSRDDALRAAGLTT
jgi:ketosteroid isomerase-like protein